MSSEETIQILYTGDFADGTGAKLEEINKQLCEKLGISVEFLTGDIHIGSYAARVQEANDISEERSRKFREAFQVSTDKAISNLMRKIKRLGAGLDDKHRAKNIRAMRAGKYVIKRTSAQARQRGRDSAKEIAWIPESMRQPWPLW